MRTGLDYDVMRIVTTDTFPLVAVTVSRADLHFDVPRRRFVARGDSLGVLREHLGAQLRLRTFCLYDDLSRIVYRGCYMLTDSPEPATCTFTFERLRPAP